MKRYKEVIKLLTKEGWYLTEQEGEPPAIQAPDEKGTGDRQR